MPVPSDILLVEDEPGIVDFMQRVLVRAGYTVRAATDGAAALAALAERTPALVILDLVLPGISGYTVLEQLGRQYSTVPVLVITANPQAVASLEAPGVRRYLVKPFRLEELLDAVVASTLSSRER